MSRLDQILAMLKPLNDPAIDRSLSAALPTAEPDELTKLVQAILDRRQPDACTDLVECYDQLPTVCRSQA